MVYRNMEEAELARIDLVERIQQIDSQLTEYAALNNKDKAWKARAIRAKAMLNSKLMRTKFYIKSKGNTESELVTNAQEQQ